jgi:hypothetical protein
MAAAILLAGAPVLAQSRPDASARPSRGGGSRGSDRGGRVPAWLRERDVLRSIAEDLRPRYPRVSLDALTAELDQGKTVSEALTTLGVASTDVQTSVDRFRQAASAVTTNRTDPDPPHVDERGEYEISTSFDATFTRLSVADGRLPQSAWLAAGPRLSMGLNLDAFVSTATGSGARASGAGDVYLSGYFVALQETARRVPKVTGFYDVKLPTAPIANQLGSGEYDHTIGFEVAKGFGTSRSVVVVANVSHTWLGLGGGARASALSALAGADVLIGTSQKLGFRTTWAWAGAVAGAAANADTENSVLWTLNDPQAGTTYTLQVGPRIGLTADAPRWAAVARLTVTGAITARRQRTFR